MILTQVYLAARIDPLKGGAKRLATQLISRHFSYIVPRLFSWARVEK
jgi:hypothetical protein